MAAYLPLADAALNADVVALGALAGIAALPGVTDVLVRGDSVAIDRGAGLEPVNCPIADSETLARELIAAGGRHIDEITPIADVRLGRARVHAVLPPIATHGAIISVRLASREPHRLDELAAIGMADAAQLAALREAIAKRHSLLISGATGAGKSTLLAALLAELDASNRIIAIEEVAELRSWQPQFVALEERQANQEGAGRIGLAELVRAALRMRPDWLVVGECRGRELPDFLSALNTGHAGAGTIHANRLSDVPARLEALGAIAGLGSESVGRLAASGFRLVVHLEQLVGRRRIAAIGRFCLRAGVLEVEPC